MNADARSIAGIFQAARTTPLARCAILRFDFKDEVAKTIFHEDVHLVDLCLTPRPRGACARFSDVWAQNRYERFGGVFLLPAGFAAQARSRPGTQKSVVTWLNAAKLSEWLEDENSWSDRWLSSTLDIGAPQVRSIMALLARELEHPGFAGDVMTDLLNLQLGIELGRFYRSLSDHATGGLPPWRLRLIEERVRELGSPPALQELANLVGLSVRQLTRSFRDSRGVSIGAFIEDVRIAEARRLLEGERSIKDVAYRMGFASPSGFSYAFKAATGETPREFRSRVHSARVLVAA
jgi:AraC family transcriptional regulator